MSICPECHRVVSYQPFRKESAETPQRYFAACPNCRQTQEVAKQYFIDSNVDSGCYVLNDGIYVAWCPTRGVFGFPSRRAATEALAQDIIDHINELADRIDHLQSLQEADE